MIYSITRNYFKSAINVSMFSLIFLLSLHCASFAQSERGKEPNIPASAGATKPSDAQQILKDEVKLEKSWIKDKKKEDSIGKLISALDQKTHEKKSPKVKKSQKPSQVMSHKKVKKTRSEKRPQSLPTQENDTIFDDLFGNN